MAVGPKHVKKYYSGCWGGDFVVLMGKDLYAQRQPHRSMGTYYYYHYHCYYHYYHHHHAYYCIMAWDLPPQEISLTPQVMLGGDGLPLWSSMMKEHETDERRERMGGLED